MEIKNGKINILPRLPKLADFSVMKHAPVGFLYSKDSHALTILWKILDKKQIMVENWIMKSKIIISEQEEQLIPAAFNMLKYSYSPYSNFKVGAALLSSTGRIFGGCNIENSSFGATVCAERTAIFKAVSEGEKSFSAICIVGGKNGDVQDFCSPCGICRQVLSEFCKPDFKIILASSLTDFKVFTLSDLLPENFSLWWIFEMLFAKNSSYFSYREDIMPFALSFSLMNGRRL